MQACMHRIAPLAPIKDPASPSSRAQLKVAEQEIQRSREAAAGSPHGSGEDGHHLRSEAARLRAQVKYAWKQVAEMKSFLSDYGLVWVGEPDVEGLGDPSASATPSSSSAAAERRPAARNASQAEGGEGAAAMPPRPPAQDRQPANGPGPRGLRRLSSAGASSPLTPPSNPPAQHEASHQQRTPVPSPPHPADVAVVPAPHSYSPTGNNQGHVLQPLLLPVSVEKLLAAVEELNQVANDGIGQVVGGRITTPEPVRLVLFQDGLQLHRSAAKSYSDPASVALLKDVLDGYFPSALKQEFPDGIPIKVVDRTSETTSSAAAARGNVHSFHDLEDKQAQPLSKDKFLSKLPQTVIKNGKVIEIRSEVGRIVQGPGKPAAPPQHVSTPADALLTTMQRNHNGPSIPAAATRGGDESASTASAPNGDGSQHKPGQEISTLQVKSEDGKQTFILKMQYDDTIFALRKCIDAHRLAANRPLQTILAVLCISYTLLPTPDSGPSSPRNLLSLCRQPSTRSGVHFPPDPILRPKKRFEKRG